LAITARVYIDTSMVSLDLHPDDQREWVSDLPDERPWPFDFDFDARKIERGEYELGAIRVGDVRLITDYWLQQLDTLDLPRVDIVDAGLTNVTISDALRWVRRTYSTKYATSAS